MNNYTFNYQDKITMDCPEGSAYWALAMMLNGKTVISSISSAYKIEDNMLLFKEDRWIKSNFTFQKWINVYHNEKWRIYEEPKLKVGDWVRHIKAGFYCQIHEVYNKTVSLRHPGELIENVEYHVRHNILDNEFELASLEPDFSDAKIEDKVFNILQGYTEIDDIVKDFNGKLTLFMPMDSSTCANESEECGSDGRRADDSHPMFFNDHYQAQAYFAEMFRKLDGEEQ